MKVQITMEKFPLDKRRFITAVYLSLIIITKIYQYIATNEKLLAVFMVWCLQG